MWDIPSAGHVDAGEDLLDACVRETFEELGIRLTKDEFIFQCQIIERSQWELSQQYLVKNVTKTESMKINHDEIADLNWLSLEKFNELLYSEDFVPHSKEYKDTVVTFIKRALLE